MTARRLKRREGVVTVTAAAGHLNRTARELFAFLRREGWLPPQGHADGNKPTVMAQANGWMEWDDHSFRHKSDGRLDRSITPLITRAGFRELKRCLEEEGTAHDPA